MSDQGDLARRWNAPSEDADAHKSTDEPTGPMPKVDAEAEPGGVPAWSEQASPGEEASWEPAPWNPTPWDSAEPETPEIPEPEAAEPGSGSTGTRPAEFDPAEFKDEPAGKLVFSEAKDLKDPATEAGFPAGGTESEPMRPEPTVPDAGAGHGMGPWPTPEPAPAVERADVSAPAPTGWEGSLFDGSADSGPVDDRYAPVMPSGPGTPPKPGTPSSGNLRLPDWMREENGGGPAGLETDSRKDAGGVSRGGSRVALFAGLGLLLLALLAAAGVYFLKSGDDAEAPHSSPPAGLGRAATGPRPQTQVRLPADKALRRFPGTPTRVAAQVTDAHAGLAYPRFAAPWQLPTKQNRLGQVGWSGQQIVVTERRGPRLWYGQLLSGTLGPAEMSAYGGPGTEQAAAAAFARSVEARFYGFPHHSQPFASQPLTVDGHKGWLVSSYLRYQRPGIKATGELVVTAVIDTGRKSPAVLFMAVPNTHRKLWADITYFLDHLHLAR
jgi:hypothetical protein